MSTATDGGVVAFTSPFFDVADSEIYEGTFVEVGVNACVAACMRMLRLRETGRDAPRLLFKGLVVDKTLVEDISLWFVVVLCGVRSAVSFATCNCC